MNEQRTAPAFESPEALIDACVVRGGAFHGQFPAARDRRVLVASHELGLNGAPIVLLYMARSLRRLGWQPVLISPAEGPLLDRLLRESFPVLVCPSLLENDVMPRAVGLFRFVVLNTLVFAPVVAALNGAEASVLWWLHEAEEIYQNNYAQKMPYHLFSNIAAYAVSLRSREHLLRHRPDYSVGVLPFGLPDAAERDVKPYPLSEKAGGKRVFALVGTLERRKGQDVLLDAVALLPEDVARQCFFVFVGQVFHHDIGERVRVAASEQADRFQYIPQLPMEEMPAFYSAIDCMVCASRDDPVPTTVVEGCQLSKSVICSEHTGMAPILERDRAGFVYDGDDPAALARCIAGLLGQSAGDAAAMRKRARDCYLSRFSFEAFDRRLETEILPELLGPALLSDGPEASARLLRMAESGRQRLLRLERTQKQALETQERAIREKQAQIEALDRLNETQAQTIREQRAHIELLAGLNEKQAQTIREQQGQIGLLEAQKRSFSESYNTISSAAFWRITKPFRFTLDVLKWLLRPRVGRNLLREGADSILTNGVRVTWQNAMREIYLGDSAQSAGSAPFTAEALEEQRKHSFQKEIKFSIVAPLYNTPKHYLQAMIDSVRAQTYAHWELCLTDGSDAEHAEVGRIARRYARRDRRVRYQKLEKNLGISGNTNVGLEMATGDYIGLLDHDDLLHPAALYEIMRTIENTGADFIYTDESTFHDTPEDAYLPHFKPDFAPDNLRANNYICHFTVFERALLDAVGPFDPACDGSQDHDMALRLTEKARRVAHIPEILYYWRAHADSVAESAAIKPYVIEAGVRAVEKQLRRLGMEGEVMPVRPGVSAYRIRYAIKGTPKVSILIPNHEHLGELRTCLSSIFERTSWPNYEIVIVENNSRSQEIFAYYEEIQRAHGNVRVVAWKEPFNYSAVNNYGARFCTGDYLLLLNNDTEVITADWIQEMLMFAQRPDVGAVGAKLYYPDDTIQHAGVGIGILTLAGHLFRGCDRDYPGYMGRLTYSQDLSAVTGACMLIRRDVWMKMDGLDEAWAIAFNDVDLCMRIRRAGWLIVWTPFAELYHCESRSRGIDDTPEKKERFSKEILSFQSRWEKALKTGDPYYNPNLTLEAVDFSTKPALQQYDAR